MMEKLSYEERYRPWDDRNYSQFESICVICNAAPLQLLQEVKC